MPLVNQDSLPYNTFDPQVYTKLARRIFTSILAFCGEAKSEVPASEHVRQIVQKGIFLPEIRDEIYMQLLKQLRSNLNRFSVNKIWQLLCLSSCFFPVGTQRDLLMYFENHMSSFENDDDFRRAASFVLENMRKTTSQGPRELMPSTVRAVTAQCSHRLTNMLPSSSRLKQFWRCGRYL